MDPTAFDVRLVQLLAPLEAKPFWVDLSDELSQNSLFNGFIFAFPVFLFWHFSEAAERPRAQRIVLTLLIATIIGATASLLVQHVIRWPPPSAYPPLKRLFTLHDPLNLNTNSFPSDSTILYSTVAFGVAEWSFGLSTGLLFWLLLFVAPAKIFVGGHYPTDIAAGLLIGFCSLKLSKLLLNRFRPIGALVTSQSALLRTILFAWLFEVGNEFRDITDLLHSAIHILRHHL